jgi:hypothetical protein
MDPEMVTRTIQLVIAPVVMITSCCILGSGLLAHYSALGERLRLTVRERVEFGRDAGAGLPPGLLDYIDSQLSTLLHHHRLVRTSLVGVLMGIVFFIADMFMIALSVISNSPGLSSAVLIVFLAGVASLLLGALYAVVDVYSSHSLFTRDARNVISVDGSLRRKS